MKLRHINNTVIPVFMRRQEQERPESTNLMQRCNNAGRRLS